MKFLRQVLTLCAFVGAVAGAGFSLAADKPPPKDLFLKGDARCTACHDEADAPELLRLGKTRHGTQVDSRTPTCTSCHGDGEAHIKDVIQEPRSLSCAVTFGAKSQTTPEAQNGACLACHKKDAKRSHWEGSTHQARDVKCNSCHQLHAAQDKVRDKLPNPRSASLPQGNAPRSASLPTIRSSKARSHVRIATMHTAGWPETREAR